jgi:hypothetical protein
VPRKTLSDRFKGRVARVDSRANSYKFTTNEEEVLEAWILSMDKRGYPLTLSKIGDAAKILLQQRLGAEASIGVNWTNRFVNRHPTLRSQFTRKYDYQRAKCEDPEVILPWFKLVEDTITQYGITQDDIYNFDETGFALGHREHCSRSHRLR